MQQISRSIYQIGLSAVNCFLIEDNDLTLVDTSFGGSSEKIFQALQKAEKKPTDIKRILLTHCHPDHAGSAAMIKKNLACQYLLIIRTRT